VYNYKTICYVQGSNPWCWPVGLVQERGGDADEQLIFFGLKN
jgi:hypothetical protein